MAYRRGAVFVRDARELSRPLDRNQKAKILYLAERLERATKAAGRRNGCLGYIGLQVLKALLLTFHNGKTGLCSPGYGALQKATGLCRQSIAAALKRLEACGVIQIVRRLVRLAVAYDCPNMGCRVSAVMTRQDTNLYRIQEPTGAGKPIEPIRKAFPRRGLLASIAAGVVMRAESTAKGGTIPNIQIGSSYCRPVYDWRSRARDDLKKRAIKVRGGV